MELVPLDVEDRPGFAEAAAVIAAANRVDAPWLHQETPEQVRGAFAYGHDLDAATCFVGREGEDVVAFGAVHVSSWDNPALAWLRIVVHPERRRRGHGAQLLVRLEKAAAELGRTSLGTDAWEGSSGARYAERNGYSARARAVLRRLELASLSTEQVEEQHASSLAAAAGYEVLRHSGAVPEQLLEQLAEVSASINDAPLEGLDVEPDSFDGRRVRAYEEAYRLRNRTLYRVLARDATSGRLVGHSTLSVERATPAVAHQQDTTVVPQHRGHRLGVLLKTEMLRWLREAEPQLRSVDTWNMESNGPMVAVNDALGYRPLARETQYQK